MTTTTELLVHKIEASDSRDLQEGNLTDSQKRVSFGATKETIVYETRNENTNFKQKSLPQQSSESTSRVFVTASDSAYPNRIAPPSSVGMDPDRPSSASGVQHHNPPLPLLQKLENEKDNPFRPEEPLYHVVDPIVEAYKTRPFPPSPEKSSADAPLLNSTPSPEKEKGGKKGDKKRDKNGSPKNVEHLKSETDGVTDGAGVFKQDEPHRTTLSSPKAGKVELVHVEPAKKKCCKCCTIQ